MTARGELDSASRELLERLGKTLGAAGYSVENIVRRLPHRWDNQGIEAPYVLSRELDPEQPLDAFITLFYYQGSVSWNTAAAHFSAELLSGLASLELLTADPSKGRCFSLVDITPHRQRYFITDLGRFDAVHQPEWIRRRIPLDDKVMYLGSDTRLLIGATFRDHCARVLDLCCGCGVHTILASDHTDQAVGVDLNPRALRFARMNAVLNGCTGVRFLEGDLYEPLGDASFDLILANPPFVATPGGRLLFRDGGSSGEDVLSRIVSGLPRRLAPGGTCQIVTDMVIKSDLPYKYKLRQWIGEEGRDFDVLVAIANGFTPFEYALDHQLQDTPGKSVEENAEGFSSRMEFYEQMDVAAFRHGVITLRRAAARRSGWYHERSVNAGQGHLAQAIGMAFQRLGRFGREDIPGHLLNRHPRVREGTVLDRHQALRSGGGPAAEMMTLSPAGSAWQEDDARLSEERLQLLLLCDGSRTVEQILAGYSDESADGAPRLSAAEQLLRFYEMGAIDLDP